MRSPLEIRYRFGPLERRGWVGSLRPGQLVILATAVFFTILLFQALKSGLGLLGGVILLSLGALLTFVPLHGRPLNEWVPVIGVFMARKATGRSRFRSRAPEAGTRFAGGDEPVSLPDSIGKVELLAFPFRGVVNGECWPTGPTTPSRPSSRPGRAPSSSSTRSTRPTAWPAGPG